MMLKIKGPWYGFCLIHSKNYLSKTITSCFLTIPIIKATKMITNTNTLAIIFIFPLFSFFSDFMSGCEDYDESSMFMIS